MTVRRSAARGSAPNRESCPRHGTQQWFASPTSRSSSDNKGMLQCAVRDDRAQYCKPTHPMLLSYAWYNGVVVPQIIPNYNLIVIIRYILQSTGKRTAISVKWW